VLFDSPPIPPGREEREQQQGSVPPAGAAPRQRLSSRESVKRNFKWSPWKKKTGDEQLEQPSKNMSPVPWPRCACAARHRQVKSRFAPLLAKLRLGEGVLLRSRERGTCRLLTQLLENS